MKLIDLPYIKMLFTKSAIFFFIISLSYTYTSIYIVKYY